MPRRPKRLGNLPKKVPLKANDIGNRPSARLLILAAYLDFGVDRRRCLKYNKENLTPKSLLLSYLQNLRASTNYLKSAILIFIGYKRADACVGKNLQQYRMRHSSINNVSTYNARFNCI
jgi:hypothetical protein